MKNIIEITISEPILHKNDIVLFPDEQRFIVVEAQGYEITLYPLPKGNWFVTAFRFVWIEIRYRFVKMWRWIRTKQ